MNLQSSNHKKRAEAYRIFKKDSQVEEVGLDFLTGLESLWNQVLEPSIDPLWIQAIRRWAKKISFVSFNPADSLHLRGTPVAIGFLAGTK